MRKLSGSIIAFIILSACSNNKIGAQTTSMHANDTLLKQINESKKDTEIVNPKLKQLAHENDLVIAFGNLNYAWARRGTFWALAFRHNIWQLYTYEARLPPSADDEAMNITPQNVVTEAAEKIKKLYAASQLWNTQGDEDGNFCSGKKNCNINDAETWTISIATPQNIHTTTFYAPQFFEECCPGNAYRKRLITIAKEIMKLGKQQSSFPDK